MGSETINTLGMNSPSGLSVLSFTDHSISAMRITEGEKKCSKIVCLISHFSGKNKTFSDLLKNLRLKKHFGEKKRGQRQASALLNHRKNRSFNNA